MRRKYLKGKYLKVRWFDCPKCKEKNSWEVVVQGITTAKGKDRLSTERIVGYCCSKCGYRENVKLNNKLIFNFV